MSSNLENSSAEKEVCHKGSCHCGIVKWEFWGSPDIDVFDCNCSICAKKSLFHCIIHESKFKLLSGEESLTNYQFNKRIAQHPFCKVCGTESFYRPRSNPNGYGIMYRCIDSDTVGKVTIHKVDGQNWEQTVPGNELIKSKTYSNED